MNEIDTQFGDNRKLYEIEANFYVDNFDSKFCAANKQTTTNF